MSSSVASFLALSIGSPSSRYDSRRDRDDKDTGLADFFQLFGEGMMQSAVEQMRALDRPSASTPGSAGEGVEDFARNYLRRSTLEMMNTLSGQDYAGWPGNLWSSNDTLLSGYPGLEEAYSELGANPGFSAYPGLGAYQDWGQATQLASGRYLIEDALKTIAKGLGKSLEEVRATHLSGFEAYL